MVPRDELWGVEISRRVAYFTVGLAVILAALTSKVIDLGVAGGPVAQVPMIAYGLLLWVCIFRETRKVHAIGVTLALLVMTGRGSSFLDLVIHGDGIVEHRWDLVGAVAERAGFAAVLAHLHLVRLGKAKR